MTCRQITTLLAVVVLLVGVAGAQPVETNPPAITVTNLGQLRAMSPEEAAKGYPVHVKAVVTYSDRLGLCFVQDETGAVYLGSINGAPYQSGDLLEIKGITDPGAYSPVVTTAFTNIQVRAKNQPLPKPVAVSLKDLTAGTEDETWVETQGVVRDVNIPPRNSRMYFQLVSEGVTVRVALPPNAEDPSRLQNLIGARVRLQGVLLVTSQRSKPVTVDIAVPNLSFVSTVAEPMTEKQPATLDYGGVRRDVMTNPFPLRVGMIGKLSSQISGRRAILTNSAGEQVEVQGRFADQRIGEWMLAAGLPMVENNQLVLRNGSLTWVAPVRAQASVLATNANAKLQARDFQEVLYQIATIRELSPSRAGEGIPICVWGVVTMSDTNLGVLFIQQGDKGIFVNPPATPAEPLTIGTSVEVRGFSAPGIVYPIIDSAQVRVAGAEQLPDPVPVPLSQLRYGHYDSLRVKISGFVRSVGLDSGNRCQIKLAENGYPYEVLVCDDADVSSLREEMSGRQIEAVGVCAVHPVAGQPLQTHLLVAGIDDLITISAATSNYFNLPLSTVREVIGKVRTNEPVHLRTVVLGQWTRGQNMWLFISDPSGNTMAEITGDTKLRPGAELDLAGIADLDGLAPVIRFPQWRVLGYTNAPKPVQLESFSDWPSPQPGLVKVNAKVAFSRLDPDGRSLNLILSQERDLFEVQLPITPGIKYDRIRQSGSQLSVTGIIMNQNGAKSVLNGAIMVVRSPEDVVLLGTPAWWTARRIAGVAGGVALCLLAVLAWVASLHQRVRKQTEIIRKDLEAETALQMRYQLVWEASADGMRMTNEEGIVMEVNNTYCKMAGKSRQELIGQPLSKVFAPHYQNEILASYQERFRAKNFPSHGVYEITLWDGRKGTYEIANSFFTEPGKPPVLLSVVRDVTERKRLEEELRTAQKMEAVGRLAGGVAHDFNNILTVIQGYTGLCKDDTQLSTEMREMLVEIDNSAGRAATLVRQLLTFSRRQPLNIQSVDLGNVVENMIQMLKRLLGADIAINFNHDPKAPRIHADIGMMEQVVMNLSVNARDAMKSGGCLGISVHEVEFANDSQRTSPEQRPGRFVCLSVQDTGCGMDEATLARVFEPFFTTKDVGKGTGLGLSTVYGIVKQHRGWIEAVSQVGQGTKFRVYLPADETPMAESHTEFRFRT